MRLFAGIALTPEIASALDRFLARVRPLARLQWVQPANFHVTTKFIGEWPEARLEELKAALRGLPPHAPIPIAVRGLGFFPHPGAKRVLFADVHPGPELADLARDTDEALARLGVARERRPYAPHLTVARIKDRPPLAALENAIANAADFGCMTAYAFHLYLSRAGVYTQLEAFQLSP